MSQNTHDVVRSLSPDERLVLSGSLYFTDDDWLRLDSFNSATGVTLTVSGILVNPAGSVVPFAFTQVPATDRSVTTTRFRLGECFLIHATVRVTAGTVLRGQCYVTLQVQRSEGTGGLVFATLAGDYVTSRYSPTWPPGKVVSALEGRGIMRTVIGTNPAAGAEITETVPTGAQWDVHGLSATFVTSATVATREVFLTIDDGTDITLVFFAQGSQTASLTRFYRMVAFGYGQAVVGSNIPIPSILPIRMRPGWRLLTSTSSIQTGDDWGAPVMMVEEHIVD
jgi:hypothetical protein